MQNTKILYGAYPTATCWIGLFICSRVPIRTHESIEKDQNASKLYSVKDIRNLHKTWVTDTIYLQYLAAAYFTNKPQM